MGCLCHPTGNHSQGPLQCAQKPSIAHAGADLSSLSSGNTSQPQVLDFAVRSAAVEDYWSIAEVHAQSFYPSANWLLGPLLRLDRVHALQVGCALVYQHAPKCHSQYSRL